MKKISIILKDKMKISKLQVLKEITEFFKEHNFKVSQNDFDITATYEYLKITIKEKDINFLEKSVKPYNIANFDLQIHPNEKTFTFHVDVSNDEIGKFKYAKKLQVKNYMLNKYFKQLTDSMEFVDKFNYEEILQKIKDSDELNELLDSVNENIEHLNNTINNIDSIKFIYSIFDSENYKTFKELFEYIESKIV